ncbi:MAG: hypothetical protein HY788_08695 [Deltaproteobacteria bacterium]|nr:hypothetical protein [Deltaproteobacteria bacterium]
MSFHKELKVEGRAIVVLPFFVRIFGLLTSAGKAARTLSQSIIKDEALDIRPYVQCVKVGLDILSRGSMSPDSIHLRSLSASTLRLG